MDTKQHVLQQQHTCILICKIVLSVSLIFAWGENVKNNRPADNNFSEYIRAYKQTYIYVCIYLLQNKPIDA